MRIISADKLQDNVRDIYGGNGENTVVWYGDILALIDEQPTITPDRLVKRGRWIGTHDGVYYSYSCSECGAEALTEEETMHDQVLSKYCPNCGALMED